MGKSSTALHHHTGMTVLQVRYPSTPLMLFHQPSATSPRAPDLTPASHACTEQRTRPGCRFVHHDDLAWSRHHAFSSNRTAATRPSPAPACLPPAAHIHVAIDFVTRAAAKGASPHAAATGSCPGPGPGHVLVMSASPAVDALPYRYAYEFIGQPASSSHVQRYKQVQAACACRRRGIFIHELQPALLVLKRRQHGLHAAAMTAAFHWSFPSTTPSF